MLSVAFNLSLCWMPLCWGSLRWVSLRWVSLRWVSLCWVSLRWLSLCWVSLRWVSLRWVSWFQAPALTPDIRLVQARLTDKYLNILQYWINYGRKNFKRTCPKIIRFFLSQNFLVWSNWWKSHKNFFIARTNKLERLSYTSKDRPACVEHPLTEPYPMILN